MSKPIPTHVYVAGFSDGVVKVGRSATPARRLQTLGSQAILRGATLTNTRVWEAEDGAHAESLMRHACYMSELPRAWGAEYFRIEFPAFIEFLTTTLDRWGNLEDLGVVVDITPAPARNWRGPRSAVTS